MPYVSPVQVKHFYLRNYPPREKITFADIKKRMKTKLLIPRAIFIYRYVDKKKYR